ncbi:DUF6509 family protein [Bacillus massiliglaciei]|uniref:DUF6509 family protein n=1 Tax=Bacillus massiliglaciei TaxID=1816693 RepID=UPI000DA5EC35|nr:DUF6509 family protein [Bacillus massiliglaciei]
MLSLLEYSIEKLEDPFGILSGDRYEYMIDFSVSEDDELYSEKGLYIRLIYLVGEGQKEIVKYDIHERDSEEILDFDLDEEELAMLDSFCFSHLSEAE